MSLDTPMLHDSHPHWVILPRGLRMEIIFALGLVAVILAIAKYEPRRPGSRD